MSETIASVLEAAERAAAAQDPVAAERLLREAASLQEAALGPLHPDLANTLNNLGIVSEMTDRPDDAEAFYRRAVAIADAALPPDHPFVATAHKNLTDFCRARGIQDLAPVPTPPAPIPAAAARPAPPPAVTPKTDARPAVSTPAPATPEPPAQTPWGMIGLAGIALAIVVGFVVHSRSASDPVQVPQAPAAPATTPAPPPAAVTPEATPTPAAAEPAPRAPKPSARVATPAPDSISIVDARLCRTLSTSSGEWICTPPSTPVGSGTLTFYVRIRTPRDVTLQARWYRDTELRQSGELPLRANMTAGYRTYTRQTIDARGAGAWRIEIRTIDGTVLHTERFDVR
jgi:hypothetical protein